MNKVRESGMPEENLWEAFFEPAQVLERLQYSPKCQQVVEFGCGYGTFTIPAAKLCKGVVHALDIDSEMIERTLARAEAHQVRNVNGVVRDFVSQGTGLACQIADYCMLFNILHLNDPESLLRETFRVLRPSGILGIIHWNYDSATPRGPSISIRPKPEECQQRAIEAGFHSCSEPIDLPPYHYGIICERPTS